MINRFRIHVYLSNDREGTFSHDIAVGRTLAEVHSNLDKYLSIPNRYRIPTSGRRLFLYDALASLTSEIFKEAA